MPRVSFITSLYNCLDYTKEFYKSFLESAPDIDYEFIFVDDVSQDTSADWIRSLKSPYSQLV